MQLPQRQHLVLSCCERGRLPVQAMRLKHGMKFRMMAVGLKMAGHKKVANMITSSWKVHAFLSLNSLQAETDDSWQDSLTPIVGLLVTILHLPMSIAASLHEVPHSAVCCCRCGSCTIPRPWTSTFSSVPRRLASCR